MHVLICKFIYIRARVFRRTIPSTVRKPRAAREGGPRAGSASSRPLGRLCPSPLQRLLSGSLPAARRNRLCRAPLPLHNGSCRPSRRPQVGMTTTRQKPRDCERIGSSSISLRSARQQHHHILGVVLSPPSSRRGANLRRRGGAKGLGWSRRRRTEEGESEGAGEGRRVAAGGLV